MPFRPGGERDQPRREGRLHDMWPAVWHGGDQPVPVGERVASQDREPRVIVRNQQTRSKIVGEDCGAEDADEGGARRESSLWAAMPVRQHVLASELHPDSRLVVDSVRCGSRRLSTGGGARTSKRL